MATQNEIGGKFTIDIEDLKNGITQANRLMRLADSEFKAAAAGMGNWADSAKGLTAKQKQLNAVVDLQDAKVSALEKEYARVAEAQGENSAAATNLKIRINNETAAREKNRAELEKVNSALDELKKDSDDAADATNDLADKEKKAAKAGKDAGDSTESFGVKAKKAAKAGIAALAAVAAGLVTAFMGSAETTRDYRTEMGKLETAFASAGHTTQAAKKNYEELYAFMGEEDTAVEAANHLAKLVDSEQELATWTNIATGVFATFGDSLPIEGLTEAANETAKVGQVTGPLADALNWAGVSEDDFNASLAKCSTEQERQALITDTLNGLYTDASSKYKEVNKDVMAANEAQSKLNDSMAKVGQMAEPVMSLLKTKAAEALDAVVGLLDGFNDVLSGDLSIGDFGRQIVERILTGITTGAPKMAEAALTLLQSLGDGIRGNTSGLISSTLSILETFTGKLRAGAPKLIKAGLEVIQNLVKGIMDSLPELIAKLPTIVSNIAGVINDNGMMVVGAGIKLIWTLIKGIISAIPTLIANIPKIVKAIVDVITAFGWAKLGKSVFTFFKNGIMSMGGAIKSAAGKIKNSITAAIKDLPKKLFQLAKSAVGKIASTLKGASGIKSAASKLAAAAVNGIKALPKKMLQIGKDLVKGLWNGIKDMTSWIISKIKGFGNNILSGIKKFFGIKSPSRVMEQQVGKQLALGVANGIEKNSKYAKKSAAKLSQAILDAAEKRLDRYQTYHTMSLAEEKAYWDEVRKHTKKGTSAKLEADKKYIEAKRSLNEQLKAAEKEYTTSVSEAYKNLKDNITAAIEDYKKEVESKAASIAGAMSLFDEFNVNTEKTGQQLIVNLQGQVTALQNWLTALDELEAKGVDSAFLQSLREMGVGSAGEVAALNGLTEKELNEYVALWQQKNELATEAAKKELADLQTETVDKIASLVEETKTSISGYQKTYDKALKDLGVAVKKQVEDTDKVLTDTAATTILKTAPSVGTDMVDGIIEGLNNRSGTLYSTISSIISSAIASAQAAAEIASPSKVMRDLIGKNLIRGAIVGIEAESGNLYTTMRNVVDSTVSTAQGGVSSGVQPARGTVVYFTQNNNSPKALSPYEVYRQTKIANRMILEGR